MSDPVEVHTGDGVLTITINRPEARNAINLAVAQGVADGTVSIDPDDYPAPPIPGATPSGGATAPGVDDE